MKTLVIMLVFLLIPAISHADWYVVSSTGKIVAKTAYEPSLSDLASRGETAILSEEDIPLHKAGYDGQKIIYRKKTAKELSAEVLRNEIITEEAFVKDELRNMAIERLEQKGHKFKHIKKKGD